MTPEQKKALKTMQICMVLSGISLGISIALLFLKGN